MGHLKQCVRTLFLKVFTFLEILVSHHLMTLVNHIFVTSIKSFRNNEYDILAYREKKYKFAIMRRKKDTSSSLNKRVLTYKSTRDI